MNLAVKLYRAESDKPTDIPDEWPAQVKELGESTELPGEDWTLMKVEEYDDYLAQNKYKYEEWKEAVKPDTPPEVYEVTMTPEEYAAYQKFLQS